MKRVRTGLLGALVTMLVGCSDPSGPRIPHPEGPGNEEEERGGFTASLVVTATENTFQKVDR
jgi:hypothetical protein